MLGDFNIAKPKALITLQILELLSRQQGKGLPKGFQKSGFYLDTGFIDFCEP